MMGGNYDPWAMAKKMQAASIPQPAWGADKKKWSKSSSSKDTGSSGYGPPWLRNKEEDEGDSMPQVKKISLKGTDARIIKEGFPDECYAIEYYTNDIYSDAHHILQELCGDNLVKEVVTLEHDYEGTLYPEVARAWEAAGNYSNSVTVAKCASIPHWAVGLGGKKNGERAAKLGMAVTIAAVYMVTETTATKVTQVVLNYPEFGKLLVSAGILGMSQEELDLVVKHHDLQMAAHGGASSSRASPY